MCIVRALAWVTAFSLGLIPSAEADKAVRAQSCRSREQCCKICDLGKACGNACISERYTCHKGRGCACNVEELCPDASSG